MLNEIEIQKVIEKILIRESDSDTIDPNDLGGETHWGVTVPFAGEWHIPWPPTRQEAAEGYRRMMAGTRIDQIPDAPTLGLVADAAVNHGEGRAIQWLQIALNRGLVADGVIGEKTLTAMNGLISTLTWRSIYKTILKLRGLFYAKIIHNEMALHPDRMLKDSQVKFIDGWYDRLFSFL